MPDDPTPPKPKPPRGRPPVPTPDPAIGRRVRALRTARHLSQDALARRVGEGVYNHDISRIERGLAGVDAEMARRLAKALGVGEGEIMGDAGEATQDAGEPTAPDPVPNPPPAAVPAVPFADSIAGRVAARRARLRLTQAELARRMDPPTTQSYVGRLELGGRPPRLDVIHRLAAALACDPSDLDVRQAPARRVVLMPVYEVGNPTPARQTRRHVTLAGWVAAGEGDRAVLADILRGLGFVDDGAGGFGDGIGEGDVAAVYRQAVRMGIAVVLRGDVGPAGGW